MNSRIDTPNFQGMLPAMAATLPRLARLDQVTDLLRQFPVVAIVGARQVGKTTLARQLAKRPEFAAAPVHRFDLERPADRDRLGAGELALAPLQGLVVLDEVQRTPELFPLLRVLVDRVDNPARFLVLGSASPELLRQTSETLAGRIAYYTLPGLSLAELEPSQRGDLWLRGGFPRSLLADSDSHSFRWREAFIQTFLERDLPQLAGGLSSVTMRRFWTMLAHYHGQIWNAAEFSRSFGVSDKTVRRYLDALTATFVVRQLQPWHANVGKRQVKSPKHYIADSGLMHGLLGLNSIAHLQAHPKVGASWEGFAMGEVIERLGARPHECFFWATHAGAELDLLVVRGNQRRGFEFKYTATPRRSRSMTSAQTSLELLSLDVVHAGEHSFPISEKIRAVAIDRLLLDVDRLE